MMMVLARVALEPAERRVRLPSEGWILVGDFQPVAARSAPAVLLLNGAARDRRAYAGLASELATRGVASLRLDLRGEGESTNRGRFVPGRRDPALERPERDVRQALGWLRRQPGLDSTRIGVLGASYSGEAMAIAARTGAAAAAYVALSPGSFSDESARAIDRAGWPWWFIASRQERFAGRVVERIGSLSRAATVTLVEGTSHASDILSPHWNLEAEIADWFAARLRGVRAPELWGGLEPGAHPVGFRRIAPADSAKDVVLDLWYPAARAGSPMRFGDYLALADDLRGAVAGSPALTLASTVTGDSTGLEPGVATRILASPMAATRDADRAGGRFPLLLWTPRYGTTVAQSVLCEYLASHGFVVAFPRPAAGSRLPFELPDAASRGAELDARIADLETTLARLASAPGIDAGAVGLLAWSYTGEMATTFQLTEPRVKLVAGLSTNLLDEWIYRPEALAGSVDRARLGAAYAVITQGNGTGAPPARLARVDGARYFIELPGLAHGSFNTLEGYLPSLLGVTRVQRWSMSGPAGAEGYRAVAAMVLRLARHHVAARSETPLSPLVLGSGLRPGVVLVR